MNENEVKTTVPSTETVSVTENKENTTVASPTPTYTDTASAQTVTSPVSEVPAPVTETPQQKFDRLNPAGTKIEDIRREESVPTPSATSPTVTPSKAYNATATKTQADYDQFKGRENEVLTNLKNAYDSGIKDGDGIRKFASYDTATPEKKKAIDAFIIGKRNEEKALQSANQFGNEDGVYSALVNGISIPDSIKQTDNYKKAVSRYSNYSKYANLDANSISHFLENGDLVPGTKTYNDLYANPAIKERLDRANKLLSISGKKVDVTNAGKQETANVLATNTTFASALENNELSPEEIKRLTSSPETDKLSASLAEKDKKIKTLEEEANNLEESIRSQYPGVTSGKLATLVANGRKQLDRQLNSLRIAYNSDFGVYTEKKKDLITAFETNFKLYQAKKEEEAKKAALIEQRDYETKKEARKNIYDSVSSQIKFALENGVDLKRTDANVVIADAQAYATANGVSLEEGIKKTFTEPLTSKPSYRNALQAIYDKNSGAMTDYQRAQLAQEDRRYALDLWKAKNESSKPAKSNKEWKVIGKDKYGNDTYGFVNPDDNSVTTVGGGSVTGAVTGTGLQVGQHGGQCASFAGKETGFTSGLDPIIGKDISERRAKMSDKTPVVGGLVLFDGGGYDKKYGHVAVVTAVNPDGTINVRESNFKKDETVTERKNVPLTYAKNFYNDTPAAREDGTEPHEAAVNKLAMFNNGTDYASIVKSIGNSALGTRIKSDFDRLIESQGGRPVYKLDNPNVKGLGELSEKLGKLISDTEQAENVSGGVSGTWASPWDSYIGKKRSDYISELSNVLNNSTLKKFMDVKAQGVSFGQFTQKELELLVASTNALNAAKKETDGKIDYFDLSEEKFLETLKEMKKNADASADALTGGEFSRSKKDNSSYKEGGNASISEEERARKDLEDYMRGRGR